MLHNAATRIEKDSLGEIELSDDVYYGAQTQRAVQNFSITGMPISHFPELVTAAAMTKMASAQANLNFGLLSADKASAIETACQKLIAGEHHSQFVVDAIQGGAGTSTNMNFNEVIANVALEHMGYAKGEYQFLHPNNDVNCSQSTNDVYPSSARLAIVFAMHPMRLSLEHLIEGFKDLGDQFSDILKIGRTQLQDAVPMTIGLEFHAFADNLSEEFARLDNAVELLREINLGGTAIGTRLNTAPGYADFVVGRLSEISGQQLKSAHNLVEATSDAGAFVTFSATLKRLALKLSKISNDLRLLSSGPVCGFNEINLPAVQLGSSMMPGKINPVIPEAVNQTAFQVVGNDMAITMAAESGQLQLNAMEPVIIFNVMQSIKMLTRAMDMLDFKCVRGITANRAETEAMAMQSAGLATILVPELGYDISSGLAKEAIASGVSVVELVRTKGLIDEARLAQLLQPSAFLPRH